MDSCADEKSRARQSMVELRLLNAIMPPKKVRPVRVSPFKDAQPPFPVSTVEYLRADFRQMAAGRKARVSLKSEGYQGGF